MDRSTGSTAQSLARPRISERSATLLLIGLAVLPALALLRAVVKNVVDVPFNDDWQFIPLIEQVRGGDVPWSELAAPHDEHRLLIPRILIIASTILSHGDYRVQCYITVAVVAALSGALLFLLRRTLGPGRQALWAWALLNVVLFSPIQWHNWLWPMQFCYFLPFTFLGLGLAAFYSDLSPWTRFALALACAWAATFSFVHGPLVWVVFVPVLLRDRRYGSERVRRLQLAGWVASGALACFLYFHNLFQNTADPSYAYLREGVPPTATTLALLRTETLQTLGKMGTFALMMYGNALGRGFPVPSNLRLAMACGTLLLAAAIGFWTLLARRGRLTGPAFAWIAILLHAFLTAGFVAVGRVWAGPGQPLTPRYTTFGTICALSVVALACIWYVQEASGAARMRLLVACGALLGWLGVNWMYGLDMMGEWHDVRMESRVAVHFSQKLEAPFLFLAGGRPGFLRRRAATLEKLGYMNPPLAASLRLDQFTIAEPLPDKDGFVHQVRAGRGDSYRIRGRARFGVGGHTPDAILVTTPDESGVPTIRALCGIRAPARWQRHAYMRDTEFADRSQRRSYGYFVCKLGSTTPAGAHTQLWALDFRHLQVHQIRGEVALPSQSEAQS